MRPGSSTSRWCSPPRSRPAISAEGRSITFPLDDTTAAVACDRRARPHPWDRRGGGRRRPGRGGRGDRRRAPRLPPQPAGRGRRDPGQAGAAYADSRAARSPSPRSATDPDAVGYPCVVKPVGSAGSRGVIRCDSPSEWTAAVGRDPPVLGRRADRRAVRPRGRGRGRRAPARRRAHHARGVRQARSARRAILRGDDLRHAVRLPDATLAAIDGLVARGATAVGLREGPVHAEVRVDGERLALIEIAARTIGGLCARTLRFGAGISLEEVVLRHALGPADRGPGAAALGVGRDDAADSARRDAPRGARP